ncbi:hypothetical protein F2Q70_00038513 [Brassica cretica]|uniref:Uncharacterized protein n=1 Tax=Brassica cretica TaxID=69181 RepID=A0A8S9K4Y3_BRACR|nr:hypothetical protein F2Q70_00038513 [Brassica cretica]
MSSSPYREASLLQNYYGTRGPEDYGEYHPGAQRVDPAKNASPHGLMFLLAALYSHLVGKSARFVDAGLPLGLATNSLVPCFPTSSLFHRSLGSFGNLGRHMALASSVTWRGGWPWKLMKGRTSWIRSLETSDPGQPLQKVARPQWHIHKIKMGMRHKAGMGMRKPEYAVETT